MSLNFSDDEETIDSKYLGQNGNQEEQDNDFDEDKEKYSFQETNNEPVNIGGEEEEEATEEKKKKKKTSLGFHLKNVFNDVALNNINQYIKKKRKSECLNGDENLKDDRQKENIDTYEEEEKEEKEKESTNESEDDLEKYVREEQKRLTKMIPEKDEFWDLYIYLNLKKKKRKIGYDPNYFSNAFKKILENVKREYSKTIEENLFKNEKLKEYIITDDITNAIKNLENNIFQLDQYVKTNIIKKCYTLTEINKKLTNLFNRGIFCNYIKEFNIYNRNEQTETANADANWNESYEKNENPTAPKDIKKTNGEEELHRALSTSVTIEKEKLNMLLKKILDKYVDIITRVKRHQKSEMRKSFNLFMNIINEATSKLYFAIHNVFITEENTKMENIYKTIRRKYNIHDVLSKVQKLTQKKEVYEVYRSYLVYKYKSMYDMCDEVFKTHDMQDNINIFNFKQYYNTAFSKDNTSIIRVLKEKDISDEEEHDDIHDAENEKEVLNKQRKYPLNTSYKNDVYTDDFFNINHNRETERSNEVNTSTKIEDASTKSMNEQKQNAKEHLTTSSNNSHLVKNAKEIEKPKEPEETPLERAKRIAREKKKQLKESKTRII